MDEDITFDDVRSYLKSNGFRRVSVAGPHKQTYISENHKLSVTIEESIEGLTAEDEEKIKQRLKELGYL